jgi:putative ABC transport system permease protein
MTIRFSIALSLLSLAYFFGASCSLPGREARIDKGYSLNNVLFAEVDLQSSAYSQHPKSLDFAQQAISRVESLPGVESAAVVDSLLTSDSYQSRKIYAEGAASSEMSPRYFAITPGYFRVVRIPLLAGREFTDGDGPDSSGVIIISESVARNLFPNVDPLGKRISFSNPPEENSWFTIVGVARDVRDSGQARAQIYGSYSQEANSKVNIVARTTVEPQALFKAVEREIRAIDNQVRITNIQAPPR